MEYVGFISLQIWGLITQWVFLDPISLPQCHLERHACRKAVPCLFFSMQCYSKSRRSLGNIATLYVLSTGSTVIFHVVLVKWLNSLQISVTKLNQLWIVSRKTCCSVQVKMSLYGLCPALHPHHLLQKWNSRHVVIGAKWFTLKFNPKMRDVGI